MKFDPVAVGILSHQHLVPKQMPGNAEKKLRQSAFGDAFTDTDSVKYLNSKSYFLKMENQTLIERIFAIAKVFFAIFTKCQKNPSFSCLFST